MRTSEKTSLVGNPVNRGNGAASSPLTAPVFVVIVKIVATGGCTLRRTLTTRPGLARVERHAATSRHGGRL
jgi:hypothetical protein